jgi:hypothetical protein
MECETWWLEDMRRQRVRRGAKSPFPPLLQCPGEFE